MNFLQFAIWGAYLTCMGAYLHTHGLGRQIGIFYSIQGIVSIFMPAILGIIADRWIQAQKVLGLSHLISGLAMISAGLYGLGAGDAVQFGPLFTLYTIGVAFYMPTIALSNSVAYNALEMAGLDRVKHFPPIRVFGTIGFIISMWCVDLLGFQHTANQFIMSGSIGLLLGLYAFTLPKCNTNNDGKVTSVVDMFGLRAFTLFKERKMAVFFIFSVLLGVSLQITNGFANPFLHSFGRIPEYADTFGVNHANMLISLSQISETLCILLIPFCLKKFGIKKVMLIAMFAWVLRFAFFGMGNPGPGVWLFILSCIVYGVAFDFFNISGSLFVDQQTDPSIRASAQGLFMLMTNGIGATIGTFGAQAVLNRLVYVPVKNHADPHVVMHGWSTGWYIFAAYALVVAIAFFFIFKEDEKTISAES
jgi:nucleoside transporter